MNEVRRAVALIGGSYVLLGIAWAVFLAVAGARFDPANRQSIGLSLASAYVFSLAGMWVGSVLGTVALIRFVEARRPGYILAVVAGWVGSGLLGYASWTVLASPVWRAN